MLLTASNSFCISPTLALNAWTCLGDADLGTASIPSGYDRLPRKDTVVNRGTIRAKGFARSSCKGESWPLGGMGGERAIRAHGALAPNGNDEGIDVQKRDFLFREPRRVVDRGLANGPFWAVTDGGLARGGSVPARASRRCDEPQTAPTTGESRSGPRYGFASSRTTVKPGDAGSALPTDRGETRRLE